VPLRPIAGSLMADCVPPSAAYTETIYRQVVPYLLARGLSMQGVSAGCARCQACSAMGALESSVRLTEKGQADNEQGTPIRFLSDART
jgi:hypothetical protein